MSTKRFESNTVSRPSREWIDEWTETLKKAQEASEARDRKTTAEGKEEKDGEVQETMTFEPDVIDIVPLPFSTLKSHTAAYVIQEAEEVAGQAVDKISVMGPYGTIINLMKGSSKFPLSENWHRPSPYFLSLKGSNEQTGGRITDEELFEDIAAEISD